MAGRARPRQGQTLTPGTKIVRVVPRRTLRRRSLFSPKLETNTCCSWPMLCTIDGLPRRSAAGLKTDAVEKSVCFPGGPLLPQYHLMKHRILLAWSGVTFGAAALMALLANGCASSPSSATAATPVSAAGLAQGAKIFGSTCNHCHKAPPRAQLTLSQWTTAVLHMRERAHLNQDETDALLAYLKQGTAGNGAMAAP